MFVQRARLHQAVKLLHSEGRASGPLRRRSAVLEKSSEVGLMAMGVRGSQRTVAVSGPAAWMICQGSADGLQIRQLQSGCHVHSDPAQNSALGLMAISRHCVSGF